MKKTALDDYGETLILLQETLHFKILKYFKKI